MLQALVLIVIMIAVVVYYYLFDVAPQRRKLQRENEELKKKNEELERVSNDPASRSRAILKTTLDESSRKVLETLYDYFPDSFAYVANLRRSRLNDRQIEFALHDLIRKGLACEGPSDQTISLGNPQTIPRYGITSLGKEYVENHRKKDVGVKPAATQG